MLLNNNNNNGSSSFPILVTILVAFFLISRTHFCAGEIKNVSIVHDSRPIILLERFGFGPNGCVDISVKNVTWKSKFPNAKSLSSAMGFFLVRERSYPRIFNESSYTEDFCVLYSDFVKLVFRFDNLTTLDSSYNTWFKIDVPDEYNLVFGNCQTEFFVSMEVHTEMYNINPVSGQKDFLPAGQITLPRMYFSLFIVYTLFFCTWVFICIVQRFNLYNKIHVIMSALLLFMALKMLCAFEDKMYIRNTGTPHGWDVPFYIFGFLKGVTLFTVIILIGTGWFFLKPYLQEREKNILMFIIPLQVLENIASVIISETGPVGKDWSKWKEMFLMIDIVCCVTIFIPIFWSIKGLREASRIDGKAANNLQKLTLFRRFYVAVIVYLYFTRFGVSEIGAFLSYRDEWIPIASAEGASLLFYFFIFYNFQPVAEKNPYLTINDDDAGDRQLEEIVWVGSSSS